MVTGDTCKIGRVCVLAPMRGHGIGAALITASVAKFRGLSGITRVVLGAQTHALGFYQALGFQGEGDEYQDAGIPHLDMAFELYARNSGNSYCVRSTTTRPLT